MNILMINHIVLEKNFGVIFDQFLHFDLHIDACIIRANILIGVIFRSFVSLNNKIIRSTLEYGNHGANSLIHTRLLSKLFNFSFNIDLTNSTSTILPLVEFVLTLNFLHVNSLALFIRKGPCYACFFIGHLENKIFQNCLSLKYLSTT